MTTSTQHTAQNTQHPNGAWPLFAGLSRLLVPGRRRGAGTPLRVHFVYPEIGAATRYRVQHQIEQARLAGLHPTGAMFRDAPHAYELAGCDVLYLYRLALSPRTLPLWLAARARRIPIVFDADDLVWDPQERFYSYLDKRYSPQKVAHLMRVNRRTRALMRRVDAFVFSTDELAREAARRFAQPAFVNPNVLSQVMLQASAAACRTRPAPRADQVVIGYFCGYAHVHDEDFASVAPALAAVLERYPQVQVRIYGEVHLPQVLQPYTTRIEQRAVVNWRSLPAHIAQVDINIAPLIDNPQRRCKSAIKYLEAAAVGVPTVAVRLNPYQHDIEHGVTGLLAATPDEWTSALARLIDAPAMRHTLGDAARQRVIAHHTTTAQAPHFARILHTVTGRPSPVV